MGIGHNNAVALSTNKIHHDVARYVDPDRRGNAITGDIGFGRLDNEYLKDVIRLVLLRALKLHAEHDNPTIELIANAYYQLGDSVSSRR